MFLALVVSKWPLDYLVVYEKTVVFMEEYSWRAHQSPYKFKYIDENTEYAL